MVHTVGFISLKDILSAVQDAIHELASHGDGEERVELQGKRQIVASEGDEAEEATIEGVGALDDFAPEVIDGHVFAVGVGGVFGVEQDGEFPGQHPLERIPVAPDVGTARYQMIGHLARGVVFQNIREFPDPRENRETSPQIGGVINGN